MNGNDITAKLEELKLQVISQNPSIIGYSVSIPEDKAEDFMMKVKDKFQEAKKINTRYYGHLKLMDDAMVVYRLERKPIDERWQPIMYDEDICVPIRPKKNIELCHTMKNPNEF